LWLKKHTKGFLKMVNRYVTIYKENSQYLTGDKLSGFAHLPLPLSYSRLDHGRA
jgi:hypothetical protein